MPLGAFPKFWSGFDWTYYLAILQNNWSIMCLEFINPWFMFQMFPITFLMFSMAELWWYIYQFLSKDAILLINRVQGFSGQVYYMFRGGFWERSGFWSWLLKMLWLLAFAESDYSFQNFYVLVVQLKLLRFVLMMRSSIPILNKLSIFSQSFRIQWPKIRFLSWTVSYLS